MKAQLRVTIDGKTFVGEAKLRALASSGAVTQDSRQELAHGVATKPAEAVQLLYERNFFNAAHKVGEISAELRNAGYNFKSAVIQMALKRADFLQMKGRRGSYTFVQKYPPTAEHMRNSKVHGSERHYAGTAERGAL